MKRFLVINPNSSQKMTDDIRITIEKLNISQVHTDVVRMEKAPSVLESFEDYTIAGAEVIKYLASGIIAEQGYHGLLLACFGDPSLYALKEIAGIPVIGIAEASLSLALLLGFKYSIVAAASKAKPMMEVMVKGYGLENRMTSVECLDLNIETFINDQDLLEDKLTLCGKNAILKGAEVLVLGCAGMTIIDQKVAVKLGIPIIDPIKAGMVALNGITDAKLAISKLGLYH